MAEFQIINHSSRLAYHWKGLEMGIPNLCSIAKNDRELAEKSGEEVSVEPRVRIGEGDGLLG